MEEGPLYDALLVGRIASGDTESFAELFDRHAAVVLGILVRILRSKAEAEEVLQEVFLQIWEQAQDYRPERSTPRGWIFMLARSRGLDHLRSRESRRRREEAVGRQENLAGASNAPLGTDRLEAEERHQELRSALEHLPAEQRTCIELAFYEGLTHSQIAGRLGEPLGTVKSRVLLAMKKLRQALTV